MDKKWAIIVDNLFFFKPLKNPAADPKRPFAALALKRQMSVWPFQCRSTRFLMRTAPSKCFDSQPLCPHVAVCLGWDNGRPVVSRLAVRFLIPPCSWQNVLEQDTEHFSECLQSTLNSQAIRKWSPFTIWIQSFSHSRFIVGFIYFFKWQQ